MVSSDLIFGFRVKPAPSTNTKAVQQGVGATHCTYRLQVEPRSKHKSTIVRSVSLICRLLPPINIPLPSDRGASPDVLVGLAEKRNKRLLRPGSGAPSSTSSVSLPLQPPATPSHPPQGTINSAAGSSSGLSLVLPARDANALSAKYSRHFPLSPGRKVAFKVPPAKDKGGEAAEEGGWILAVVKKVEKGNRCVSSKYEGVSSLHHQDTKYKTSRERKEAHRCKAPSCVAHLRIAYSPLLLSVV